MLLKYCSEVLTSQSKSLSNICQDSLEKFYWHLIHFQNGRQEVLQMMLQVSLKMLLISVILLFTADEKNISCRACRLHSMSEVWSMKFVITLKLSLISESWLDLSECASKNQKCWGMSLGPLEIGRNDLLYQPVISLLCLKLHTFST